MPNMYWENTVGAANAHWDTVTGNWWTSATGRDVGDRAAAVPQANDAVYMLGATAPDAAPGSAVALSVFDSSGMDANYDTPANVSISSGGTLVIGDPAAPGNSHYWNGDASLAASATFNDAGLNNGTVGDTAVLNDSASNGGTVGDGATFNDGAFNDAGGTVGDGATFNDASYNYTGGTVGDSATFNSTAIQRGTFTGSTYTCLAATQFNNAVLFTGTQPITFKLASPTARVYGKLVSTGTTATSHIVEILDTAVADCEDGNIVVGATILGVSGSLVVSGGGVVVMAGV